MQIVKMSILCVLASFAMNGFARKPVKKKPFNGYYLFSEIYSYSNFTGEVSFGMGKFKTKCKGYEISSTVRLFRPGYFDVALPFKIGFSANKFHRKTVGKRSSSVGYRLGLSYIQERERRGDIVYSKGIDNYLVKNGYCVSNFYAINCEAFWNKRLFGRVYFELNFGVRNGIENVQYSDSEIVYKSPSVYLASYWDKKAPGNYLSTKTNIRARLLFCFGKSKK